MKTHCMLVFRIKNTDPKYKTARPTFPAQATIKGAVARPSGPDCTDVFLVLDDWEVAGPGVEWNVVAIPDGEPRNPQLHYVDTIDAGVWRHIFTDHPLVGED